MGCTRFGERWDAGPEDLMVEAFNEALADAGIDASQIGAAWFGVCLEENNVGKTAGPLAQALRLPRIAATRVENACATGTEALRGAAYAVAAGAYDIVLALGVEKLKDTGYGGLPARTRGVANDLWLPNATAPGAFAQLASAYAAKHGVPMQDLKRAMAHVSVKSHANAALNPKAHLRNAITEEDVLKAATIAAPLGLYDCCGVSDGAACAILTTPEIARAQARHGARDDQGARSLGEQRRGAVVRRLGRRAHRHRARSRRPRLRRGGPHRSAPADRHGGGARLLLDHRDRAHGRPRLLGAGPGGPRRARRRVRPRRRAAGAARRRPQVLRPPDRGLGPADGVRGLSADARPGRQAPAQGHRPGAHAQPWRASAPERVRRRDP